MLKDIANGRIISIHAPHEGERPGVYNGSSVLVVISIHAPHEGERLEDYIDMLMAENFNPRSPRGGATCRKVLPSLAVFSFQSTLPTRGSDGDGRLHDGGRHNISIHAPHEGERLVYSPT